MEDNRIPFWQTILSTFLAILGIVVIIIVLNKYTDLFKQQSLQPGQNTQNTPSTTPISQYPDYDLIKGESPDPSFKVFDLIDKPEINPVSATVDMDGADGILVSTGKFDTAFLYVQGFVDFKNSFTPYDNLYFECYELNSNNFIGGHISPNNSEPIPQNTGVSGTQLLFNLNAVPYFRSLENTDVKTAYWLFELNTNKKLVWHAFVSTARPGGTLQKISIYYKCSEDTPDCKISKVL